MFASSIYPEPNLPDTSCREPAAQDFRVHDDPAHELRERLADLIDANGHAPQPVDRTIMHRAPYVLIVTDHDGGLVAGTCIKTARAGATEFGFSIVKTNHRRLGLGHWMTRCRL